MDPISVFLLLSLLFPTLGFLLLLARAVESVKWPWGACVAAVLLLHVVAWQCLEMAARISANC